MGVYTEELKLRTDGEVDIIDITGQVNKIVHRSGFKDGLVCAFVPGSTGAITTIEYEDGLLADIPAALERLFPRGITYQHELRWHDGNGHSHVRAAMLGPSLTVPFNGRNMILGTWQQIVFIELDVHSRTRRIIVQVVGE